MMLCSGTGTTLEMERDAGPVTATASDGDRASDRDRVSDAVSLGICVVTSRNLVVEVQPQTVQRSHIKGSSDSVWPNVLHRASKQHPTHQTYHTQI
jgi:hypothetical protein